VQEKFEDTKRIKRSHKSKRDRQYNDQKKDRQYNDQKTDNTMTKRRTDNTMTKGQTIQWPKEGQTIQWPKENGQKDKQWFTKKSKPRATNHHYKPGVNSCARVSSKVTYNRIT
jgi:hypothetical protein